MKHGKGIKPVVKDGVISCESDTILGADDKAGIAAIIEIVKTLKENNIDHNDLEVIFTISEGSVIKYLKPSIDLANKYDLPPFLKQTLEITQQRVDDVFGKDPEKQEGLTKWFG